MQMALQGSLGSEGQWGLLEFLLPLLWMFLFPYIPPALLAMPNNLFPFFCQPEKLEHFPLWPPRHTVWVF